MKLRTRTTENMVMESGEESPTPVNHEQISENARTCQEFFLVNDIALKCDMA